MAQALKNEPTGSSPKELNALRKEAAELYRRGRIKSACFVQEQLIERAGATARRDDHALLSLYHYSAGMEKEAADILENALERLAT